jgi:hypothetical protein
VGEDEPEGECDEGGRRQGEWAGEVAAQQGDQPGTRQRDDHRVDHPDGPTRTPGRYPAQKCRDRLTQRRTRDDGDGEQRHDEGQHGGGERRRRQLKGNSVGQPEPPSYLPHE